MRRAICLILSLLLVSASCVNRACSATITTYTIRANWEAAVGSFQTEDFSSAPGVVGGTQIPNNTDFDVGLFDVFYTTVGGVDEDANRLFGAGVGESLQLQWDNNGADETTLLEFRFDSPMTAFGADWINVNNSSNLTVTIGGTTETLNIDALLGTNNGGFVGFTSDTPFLAFSMTNAFDTFGVDDVSIVPEPSTLTLATTGFLALVAIGWRGMKRRRGHLHH